jgi:hypothetical protein
VCRCPVFVPEWKRGNEDESRGGGGGLCFECRAMFPDLPVFLLGWEERREGGREGGREGRVTMMRNEDESGGFDCFCLSMETFSFPPPSLSICLLARTVGIYIN